MDLEQAKTICLNHAGCTADQAAFSKAKLDYDDGLAVYEIEFYCSGSEHEYKVDCATGAILEYECEGHHTAITIKIPARSDAGATLVGADIGSVPY